MAQRAGVALSRLEENAPFSVTRVDGAPSEKNFFPPVEHKLDGNTVEKITSTVTRLVGFDTTLTDNGFAISYPISLSAEQRAGFKHPSHDHFMAFANGYDFSAIMSEKSDGGFDVLFIDLTPGQVAAKLAPGGLWGDHWSFKWPGGGQTILGDAGELSPQDIVDKLITPTIATSPLVNLIGIFRPDGLSAELSAILESQFPNTKVTWVSLADLSHGAAVVMHRQDTIHTEYLGADYLSLPLGIALANGTTVTVIAQDLMLPRTQAVVLTTSRDNQTTATLRFLKGTLPGGKVTIEGLTEKPKGATRIQVTVKADDEGETVVTVQEVGGTAKKVASIENILTCTAEDVKAYKEEATIKQVSPTKEGDAIGEIPE